MAAFPCRIALSCGRLTCLNIMNMRPAVQFLSRTSSLIASASQVSQHVAPRYDFVDKYDFAIYARGPGRLKTKTIEAARISIVRKTKTRQLWKIEATTPVTKKPLGSRMGKGQGKVDHYVAVVKEGQVVFQFNCDNETQASEAFRLVTFLLPMKLYFRKRPPTNKILWTEF